MRAHIPLTSIKLSDQRHRQTFDADSLTDLANSIADKGLFHAPVVIYEGNTPILVAGERRLRAMQKLHTEQRLFSYNGEVIKPGEIPITVVADLNPLKIEEAELEENILRVDLTWQERTRAFARLHAMRAEQFPLQTFGDTAEEIVTRAGKGNQNYIRNEVSRATLLEKYLDDPKVSKARSAKEAFAMVSADLGRDFRAELARRKGKEEQKHTCLHGDVGTISWTALGKFDGLLADPPYGMDAENFGGAARLEHEYSDDKEHGLAVSRTVINLACAVLKPNGIAYVFCDSDHFILLRDYAESKDLNPLRTPLIWNKGGGMGHVIGEGYGVRRSYEFLLMLFAGKKKTVETFSDILSYSPIRDKIHAAQKPVELYTRLLGISCLPGARVIDPTCGSGTIFPAAEALNMAATGIEKDEEIFKIAQGRMQECGKEEEGDG